MADERAPEVPWLQLVRFHKEIVKRAEEGFFALPANAPETDRWSSLEGFEPASMAGPWEIEKDQVRSQALLHALNTGRHNELYLGGPGFLGWTKADDGGPWVPLWKPSLYREVRLQESGEGTLLIEPAQGTWELSPLITKLLDQRNIVTELEAEDLVTKVLEDAAGMTATEPGVEMSLAVRRAFLALVPALEEDLTRLGGVPEPPAPWVLFAPPASFGPKLQYLMRDYERLEDLLENSPTTLGGLRILEGPNEQLGAADAAVLPVVPLGVSQHQSVAAALSGQSLTVVSGPPGCGKSQVVVSLLLNAWARGLTVLFVSNNNRAVDVVRERLEPFEYDVPVSVRAGALKHNNVLSVLQRVSAVAGARRSPVDAAANSGRRSELEARRHALHQSLETNVPQRADEALRAALKGYATWRQTMCELDEARARVVADVSALGYAGIAPGEMVARAEELAGWLQDAQTAADQAAEAERERVRVAEAASREAARRNDACGVVGLNASALTEWGWLVAASGPELLETAWDSLKGLLLGRTLDREVETSEWNEGWNAWEDSDQAAGEADQLRQLSNDIRAMCGELAPKLARITERQTTFEQAQAQGRTLGLNAAPRARVDELDVWMSHYTAWMLLPASWVNSLPFSRWGLEERALRKLEVKLRPALSLAVWNRIGRLDLEGRRRLSEVVEAGREWLRQAEELKSVEPLVREVDDRFTALRGRAAPLRFAELPPGTELEAWQAFADQVTTRARVADAAAVGWGKREKREAAWVALHDQASRVLEAVAGQPMWEAWTATTGQPFTAALRALEQQPGPPDIAAARAFCHSELVDVLLRDWRTARDAERERRRLDVAASALPTTRQLRNRWADGRPRWLTEDLCTPVLLPQAGDQLHVHLDRLRALAAAWQTFVSQTQPTLSKRAADELSWATTQLRNAQNILPEGPPRRSIEPLISGVLAQPEQDWPAEALMEAFKDFRPELLRAGIERLDTELGKLSFEQATAEWARRLKSDPTTLRAVDALRHSLLLTNGRIEPEHYPAFRTALGAVPIWITVAQAAHAVPVQPALFDLVVIDEATQCTLTNLLPLLFRGKRLVVIGDRHQLPAIPSIGRSEQVQLARKFGVEPWMAALGHFGNDVFDTGVQSLPRRLADVNQLTDHFRSHPMIIGFSNREVYRRQLRLRRDPTEIKRVPFGPGVHVRKVIGSAERGDNRRSWRNVEECAEVLKLIASIRESGDSAIEIGVVTPFTAQKKLIADALDREDLLQGVTVDVAHGYQGDERDVMIFSTVITPHAPDATARWVEEPHNLINVPVTRARESLYLLGHLDYCRRQRGILGKLVRYCETAELLRRTSEAELELFSWMAMTGWSPEVHVRVGNCELDFVLRHHGLKLDVEVDGRQHEERTQADAARDAFLVARGYKVLRVPAREVMETPTEVLAEIRRQLGVGPRQAPDLH